MSSQEGKQKPAPARKKALGRGLAALLGDSEPLTGTLPTDPRPGEKVVEIPLERLEPNPFQPRRHYEPESLQALADSIAEHGLLQPVLVRPVAQGYQLIAGERRMRATQLAGITSMPAVVRQASDQQALLLALLENLQREDLGPLEEARAFQRLKQEFELSQEEIAKGVGKERSTVANALRLLNLPDSIQQDLAAGKISAGHARALLSLPTESLMRKARDQIIQKGLSVRAAERLVKSLTRPPKPRSRSSAEVYLSGLAEEISRHLGTKVEITRRGKRGRIQIEYYTDQDLERLLAVLRREQNSHT
ncbi:MAG: ParB/RepB/Spo0J family partition protein [Desulfarculaceae bacterium]|jgi:ParB family chromosome partitioning protein